jgi:hypothetical protein
MQFGYKILMVVFGGAFTVLLEALTLIIENHFNPSTRNLFGFGAGLIFIVPFLYGFWGLLLSTILIFIKSFYISMTISILFSLWLSWKTINSAIEIYNRPNYFDREYFVSDVFQICANFIIFPLVCILIWVLKEKYFNNQM